MYLQPKLTIANFELRKRKAYTWAAYFSLIKFKLNPEYTNGSCA